MLRIVIRCTNPEIVSAVICLVWLGGVFGLLFQARLCCCVSYLPGVELAEPQYWQLSSGGALCTRREVLVSGLFCHQTYCHFRLCLCVASDFYESQCHILGWPRYFNVSEVYVQDRLCQLGVYPIFCVHSGGVCPCVFLLV